MVADGVHIMCGLALVLLITRSRDVEPYLVAALAAEVPDVDVFLFHFVVRDLRGLMWAHRGITHSLAAAAAFVLLASLVAQWRAAAVGYLSHLSLDLLTGGVLLLAPLDTAVYGVSTDWYLLNGVVGFLSVAIIVGGLAYFTYGDRLPVADLDLRSVR